jgi:hypothetical protein
MAKKTTTVHEQENDLNLKREAVCQYYIKNQALFGNGTAILCGGVRLEFLSAGLGKAARHRRNYLLDFSDPAARPCNGMPVQNRLASTVSPTETG